MKILYFLFLICLFLGPVSFSMAEKHISMEISKETSPNQENPSYKSSTDFSEQLRIRFLGEADAPITLIEYSSMTCPHCKSFHDSVLPKLIENYIDKGLVKYVYGDFPLNLPALRASLTARCFTQNEQYFRYINFLFKTQDKWAFAQNPEQYLRQNAKLLGISHDDLYTCLDAENYEESFLEYLQTIRNEKNINSTPTFIIEETGQIIQGAKPYILFENTLNKALKKQNIEIE